MTSSANISAAQMSILFNRIGGINRKMASTILRTGRSGVLNRARDFSTCILTADCKLLYSADSIPIHTLSGPDLMAKSMLEFHPKLKAGDAFIHNSPYHGNSHAADHGFIIPVIDDEGIHRFTIVTKAHQADIGNAVPSTMMATARDVYEEGALIFPCVQIQRDYKDIDDIIRMCRARIRVPNQWYGDLLATIGAARIGETELLNLGKEIGWDKLSAFVEQWFDYSEKRMVDAIGKLTSGSTVMCSQHDSFPGTGPEGVTVTAKVTVDAEAAMIDIDFRDCPDALPSGLNLTEATSRTAGMIGVFNSIDASVPKNFGSFRRIRVHLRENCVVGIPRHPTSCSLATTNLADRAGNCVQMAIAEISEGAGMAEVGYSLCPTTSTVSGIDPRDGKPYVNMVFLGHTSGAAGAHSDSWLTVLNVGCAGICNIDGVELSEVFHPLVVRERRLLTDTEGAGRFRGAPAIRVEFGPIGADMTFIFASDGTENPPRGVRGGGSAHGAGQFVRDLQAQITPIDKVSNITLKAGENMIGIACGGGGYGNPVERAVDLVLKDVAEGWISPERARDVYKVAIIDNVVDMQKTSEYRNMSH
ncbi:hydantoinase B/oxoprolinase family protein [Phyllobacterium zundukense]|uniref:Hydantoinase B/oxoprolinase family protein n=1 Tax=Phyllobacterium zundukense TaxID=1867719 RepID=A0ACD4CVH4_9HYPH|nr:hydantoinase B/oxoprolinase family protein [Phyllobacterium zundukense]UXN57556.1 hydantoinase B/oxoprolinase family protein [Phyllobacterium zundukense]